MTERHTITEFKVSELETLLNNSLSAGLKKEDTVSFRDCVFNVGYLGYVIEFALMSGHETIRAYEVGGHDGN